MPVATTRKSNGTARRLPPGQDTVTVRNERSPAGASPQAASRRARLPGAGRILDPAASLEQRQQDLVAVGLQLGNRALAHFLVHSGDQLLPDSRRQFRRAKHFPPGRHGASELVEEMLDAARAAAQVI